MINEVKVFGKRLDIKTFAETALGTEYLGRCDHIKGVITLNEDMCPDQTRDTLLHEILHSIDYAMSTKMTEEQVHAIASGLLCVLRDNLPLVKFLIETES